MVPISAATTSSSSSGTNTTSTTRVDIGRNKGSIFDRYSAVLRGSPRTKKPGRGHDPNVGIDTDTDRGSDHESENDDGPIRGRSGRRAAAKPPFAYDEDLLKRVRSGALRDFIYGDGATSPSTSNRNRHLYHNNNNSVKTGKKRRKLVRGSELNASRRAKKLMEDDIYEEDGKQEVGEMTEDEESSMDESGGDEAYEEIVATTGLDEQTLEFLNTASPVDITALAETSLEKAKVLISKRPFLDLDKFASMDFLTEAEIAQNKALNADSAATTAKKRGRGRVVKQKKDGEKFLEKISQSIRGFNAIESLLRKCAAYGDSIELQMKKWGVNLERGDSGDAELNLVDIADSRSGSSSSSSDEVEEVIDVNADISGTKMTGTDASISSKQEEDGQSHEMDIVNKVKKEEQKEEEDNDDDVIEEDTKEKIAAIQSDEEESDDSDYLEDEVQKGRGKEEEEEEEGEAEDDDDDEDFAFSNLPGRRFNKQKRGQQAPKQELVKFFSQKPKYLSPEVKLKGYQQVGINWLNLLYQNHISCILADDMGLGKTCQVISFLAHLLEIGEPGPHLIVVPSSTLENWLREFKKFCPRFRVEPYYGSLTERRELREYLERNYGKYDVIVTTYNLAAGNKQDVAFMRKRRFNVVVYDEGHMLKNSMSERFNKLMKIDANFRLLLTGTPLQNNLRELMSLLEFIMPSLFIAKKESLASVFKQRAKTTDESNPLLVQEAINRAKTMMKPFILRRHKDQVLGHLPKKHHRIVTCEMNATQRELYNREIQHVMEHRRLLREGKTNKSTSKNLIMSLRKASIHPLLFRHIYTDSIISSMSKAILREPQYAEDGNQMYIMEDMSVMSDFELHNLCLKFPDTLSKYKLQNDEWMQSGKVEKLEKILDDVVHVKKEKILIFTLFTQVLDILEAVLSTLNYKFLRLDGATPVNERQLIIDRFHEDESIPVFVLSTKAGGFGINLTCANNVIIFDQSFNPHDDRQAADRAHRVGQTKEVIVTTLITKDSIEEKIHKLAKNKIALDLQISEDDNKKQDALETKMSGILEDMIYEECDDKKQDEKGASTTE